MTTPSSPPIARVKNGGSGSGSGSSTGLRNRSSPSAAAHDPSNSGRIASSSSSSSQQGEQRRFVPVGYSSTLESVYTTASASPVPAATSTATTAKASGTVESKVALYGGGVVRSGARTGSNSATTTTSTMSPPQPSSHNHHHHREDVEDTGPSSSRDSDDSAEIGLSAADSSSSDSMNFGSTGPETIRSLFDSAYVFLNPSSMFRFVVYLYAERKLLVLYWAHFLSTMIIWSKCQTTTTMAARSSWIATFTHTLSTFSPLPMHSSFLPDQVRRAEGKGS